jgi:hypothetical protein
MQKRNKDWEKQAIDELSVMKTDHIDWDDNREFNYLCSEEINKIMDIFEPIVQQSFSQGYTKGVQDAKKK